MKKTLIVGGAGLALVGRTIKKVSDIEDSPYKQSGVYEITGSPDMEEVANRLKEQDRVSDAVVQAANEAWDIQQNELLTHVRIRLEALGYRFDSDAEFNKFVQKRVTSHVIRDTTDNVVMLNRSRPKKGSDRSIPLLTYSTAVDVESKDGIILIKIG